MKKYQVLIIIISILLIGLTVFGYPNVINSKLDSVKFKNEYEKLNRNYYKISIPKKNNIKYSTYEEIFDIIENDTAIIYLGYAEDNDSRYGISVLLNMLYDKKSDVNIYYLDIHNDMDRYAIIDGNLEYEKDNTGKEIKGTDEYQKLVKYLDKYLFEYSILYDGTEHKTDTKMVIIPSFVFVKGGNIIGLENASINMEYIDLYDLFGGYLNLINSNTCDINTVEPC